MGWALAHHRDLPSSRQRWAEARPASSIVIPAQAGTPVARRAKRSGNTRNLLDQRFVPSGGASLPSGAAPPEDVPGSMCGASTVNEVIDSEP